VDNPDLRLLFYATAVAGACVEILCSIEAGLSHPSLYWAAVAGIVPCGFLGILCIRHLYAGPADSGRAPDLADPVLPTRFAEAPASTSDRHDFIIAAHPVFAGRVPMGCAMASMRCEAMVGRQTESRAARFWT
jgi:hypothetical protein